MTLHNLALAASEEDTAGCFSRLHHLLTSNCFPAEAFSNLLLLYCSPQHALYDAAADLMAQNPDLVENSVSKVTTNLHTQRLMLLMTCKDVQSFCGVLFPEQDDVKSGKSWLLPGIRGGMRMWYASALDL